MSETREPALLVDRDDSVVTLALNRPDKRNAFNAEMLCRLCDAWDMIDADDGVRVAIMTGAGGNFSAGADLDRLVGAMIAGKPAENEFEERIRADPSLIYKGFLKEHRPATPIVAAVEGYCYAGGIEILQAFDVRVAAEGARIAVSEVQRGLFPMAGSTVRLPRQIPWTVAMEMLITGEPISGRRAYEVGLVGHVVPDGAALERAREIAGRIARNGPLAVRNIKASVLAAEAVPESEAFARESELGMAVVASNDAREGPRAFLEKREPNFTGS
jgi:enoyl-CoA hydratase